MSVSKTGISNFGATNVIFAKSFIVIIIRGDGFPCTDMRRVYSPCEFCTISSTAFDRYTEGKKKPFSIRTNKSTVSQQLYRLL